jgi:aminopeptidase N
MLRAFLLFILCLGFGIQTMAQLGKQQTTFDRADTLRGSIGPERMWWDVTHYDVTVQPDFDARTIQGTTTISFRATAAGSRMQVDLQEPLVVDKVLFRDAEVKSMRDGNVLWVDLPETVDAGVQETLTVRYHGVPREARNPPWDGGWIWKKDSLGNPWMSVACQGLGASAWYPCKDHQSDEPDSASIHIVVPDTLQAIGNGRLRSRTYDGNGLVTWNWAVTHPINSYNLVPYIGKYIHFDEEIKGLNGPLFCDYWVLDLHDERTSEEAEAAYIEKVERHIKGQISPMMACFEEWLGPYPFYRDSYKLVEAPHLGMEHQSAIAYGNQYRMGYLGQDISGSGHGMKWDFIIVHESGHEWFGNSITTADIADMWIHEGFTSYTEVLMTECISGKTAADEYLQGIRKNIGNRHPVIGSYGVNHEGSGDMYPKGANLIHMVRQVLGDSAFKAMLRDMDQRYRHSIVTSAEIEAFMDSRTPLDLKPMFDVYLRGTAIPVLEWGVRKGRMWRRWTNCPEGFAMPVQLVVDGEELPITIVRTEWSAATRQVGKNTDVQVDANWYVGSKPAPKSALKKLKTPPVTTGTPSF